MADDYGDPITGDFTTKLPALCLLHQTEEYCGFFLMHFSVNVTHLRLATQLDNLPSPTSQQTLADVLWPTGWPVNVLYPAETGWLMDTKCLSTVVRFFETHWL